MSPVTHFLSGWLLSHALPRSTRRERALITLACIVPDVDGLGIVPELLTRHSSHPLLWFSRYHHSLHTLTFAIIVAVIAFALARARRLLLMGFVFAASHLHLLQDVLGSRGPDGYQWPVPYTHSIGWSWSGQWLLNGWQNIALTAVLVLVSLYIGWRYGRTPLELFSTAVDGTLVRLLRERFGNPQCLLRAQ